MFYYISAKITKQLQVYLACHGELSIWDRQTHKFICWNNRANISSNYTVIPGTQVLAVRCRNFQSKPWMIGSASNGLVTDTRWKCWGLPKKEWVQNIAWSSQDFDDSQWAQAVASSNQEETPWGRAPDISHDAFWITTADEDVARLFCRRRLSDMPLQKLAEHLSKGVHFKIQNFKIQSDAYFSKRPLNIFRRKLIITHSALLELGLFADSLPLTSTLSILK